MGLQPLSHGVAAASMYKVVGRVRPRREAQVEVGVVPHHLVVESAPLLRRGEGGAQATQGRSCGSMGLRRYRSPWDEVRPKNSATLYGMSRAARSQCCPSVQAGGGEV